MTRSNFSRSAGKATALLLAAAMVASTAPVLPRGWEAATLLSGERDESAVAAYQLGRLAPDDYEAAIRHALAPAMPTWRTACGRWPANNRCRLPHRLDQGSRRRARRRRFAHGRGCLGTDSVSGNAESEPALAGALAADLSGFGDMRDLYQQSATIWPARSSTRPRWRWPRSASR